MPPSRGLGWTRGQTPDDVLNRLRIPKGRAGEVAQHSQIVRSYGPPNSQKLPQSTDFSVDDFAMALAAGAGAVITSANLIFALPAGAVGWLQESSFYVLNQTASTSVRFDVRINGGVVPGFSFENPPGVANIMLKEKGDMGVRIPNGGIVDIIITNLNANGPWTVGGSLAGWFHHQSVEDQVYGPESGF